MSKVINLPRCLLSSGVRGVITVDMIGRIPVPSTLSREVSVVVSVSGRAQHPVGRDIVEFQAVAPGRGIIRKEAHVQQFRSSFNAFLQQLFTAGARVLHIHPATPLSASIEIGRTVLPKAFEEVHIWEWQAPNWKSALRLK